jgi:hypothetical protein
MILKSSVVNITLFGLRLVKKISVRSRLVGENWTTTLVKLQYRTEPLRGLVVDHSSVYCNPLPMFHSPCRRLINNSIVCWNYRYLSRVLAEEKNEKPRAALIEVVRNGSVATWVHFNLHGEFDFSDERMVDSMGLTTPKNPGLKLG